MYLDSESIRQTQRSIGRMPLTVYHNERRLTLCWVRLVADDSESLLTESSRHTGYEIEYALRGCLTVQMGNECVQVEEGGFLVVPPKMSHQIIGSTPGGVKFIMGFFCEAEALQVRSGACVRETPVIRSLVEIITDVMNGGSRELLCSVMQSTLLAFMDAVLADTPQCTHQMDREQSVRRFLDFVKSSNGVGISVQEGAQLVSLSERQLFRHCLSLTGRTPSAIIQQARLSYIRSCLAETQLNLSEIAELAGFQTEYAMAKFFRKSEGMLPSVYRQRKEQPDR